MSGPLTWYRNWKQRRADRKAIAETLTFMSKWKTYDIKKAEEAPLPVDNPFAAKVAEIRKASTKRKKPDPYAFDKAMRELVGSDANRSGRVEANDEELIDATAKRMEEIWRTPNERWSMPSDAVQENIDKLARRKRG